MMEASPKQISNTDLPFIHLLICIYKKGDVKLYPKNYTKSYTQSMTSYWINIF